MRHPGTTLVWVHAQVGGPKPICPEEGTRAQANPTHHFGRLRCPLWGGAPGCAPGAPPQGMFLTGLTCPLLTGRKMPCGRRRRASTTRCPAQHPATQVCVPAVAKISASSPGGTTAGALWGHWGWHRHGTALTTRSLGRLCHGKVCHTCSVDVGKHGRCCLLCYQQRHPQTT